MRKPVVDARISVGAGGGLTQDHVVVRKIDLKVLVDVVGHAQGRDVAVGVGLGGGQGVGRGGGGIDGEARAHDQPAEGRGVFDADAHAKGIAPVAGFLNVFDLVVFKVDVEALVGAPAVVLHVEA